MPAQHPPKKNKKSSSSSSSSTASTASSPASSTDASKLPGSIPEEKPMVKIDLKRIKSIGNYTVGFKIGEVSKSRTV